MLVHEVGDLGERFAHFGNAVVAMICCSSGLTMLGTGMVFAGTSRDASGVVWAKTPGLAHSSSSDRRDAENSVSHGVSKSFVVRRRNDADSHTSSHFA